MNTMNFQRKAFLDAKAIILSEKPLAAAQLEERISSLIPSLEARLDSFEDYISAYEHCSNDTRVGVFYLHFTEQNTIPINAIDELASKFESIGSSAGIFVIAENEKMFAESYKLYGSSKRLLGIALESDLTFDAALKEQIFNSWGKFEYLQKSTAVPQEEMDFILRISSRFDDTGNLARLTNILTSKLDRNWLDNLIIEASPALLTLPEQQRWVLNNSPSLLKIYDALEPYKGKPINELLNSKDGELVIRATITAHAIHEQLKIGNLTSFLDQITKGSSSFSATLTRIVAKERINILELFSVEQERKTA